MKKLISLQLEEELLDRLKNYVKKIGGSLTGVIRVAVEEYLDRHNG